MILLKLLFLPLLILLSIYASQLAGIGSASFGRTGMILGCMLGAGFSAASVFLACYAGYRALRGSRYSR